MKLSSAWAKIVLVCLLAVIVLAVFWPFLSRPDVFLSPRSGLGTDIGYRHWPDLTGYARALREQGQIPLWDDGVALGRPLAGDPGVLWLYPFDLVFLLAPPAAAFSILAALHVLIAGVLMMWFCRVGLQRSYPAALLGGLAFMLMPKFISHLAGGHVGLVYGVTWVPLAMLGTFLAAARGQWQGGVLAGLTLALQLFTHIQIPFYTAVLMGAYFLWLWLPDGWAAIRARQVSLRSPIILRAGAFALAVVVFVGLAAAELFPFLSVLPFSSRAAFTAQDAAWYTLPVPLLATIIIPIDFQFPEWTMYVGLVPALLAVLGIAGPRRRQAIFFVGVVLLTALYSIGPATPVFSLIRMLPGFSQLRVPPRMWFFGSFGLACLAAYGVDALATLELRQWYEKHQKRIRLMLALALVAGVTGILTTAVMRQSPWRQVSALVIGASAVGLLARQFAIKSGGRMVTVGLIGLTLIDLGPTARLYTMAVPPESIAPSSPALEWLAAQPGVFRVYSPHGELPYAQAPSHGVQAAEGLLAFQMGHAVELIKLATGCTLRGYATGIPPCLTSEIDPKAYLRAEPNARLLGLLNVKYVLASHPLANPDLTLVADFGGQRIYQNGRALPRTFVVSAARTLESEEAVLSALPAIEPGAVALLASPLPRPLTDSAVPQEANIASYHSGRMQILVSRATPGLLVVSQTWMPGWRATDNERAVNVLRVNYALTGIYLDAGEHHVELVYDPPEWEWGWRVSAGTLAVLALVMMASCLRRKVNLADRRFWRKSRIL